MTNSNNTKQTKTNKHSINKVNNTANRCFNEVVKEDIFNYPHKCINKGSKNNNIGLIVNSDALTLLKNIKDNTIGAIFTSPPFNINLKYKQYIHKKILNEYNELIKNPYLSKIREKYNIKVYTDKMNNEYEIVQDKYDYYDYKMQRIREIREFYRILKQGGIVIYNILPYVDTSSPNAHPDYEEKISYLAAVKKIKLHELFMNTFEDFGFQYYGSIYYINKQEYEKPIKTNKNKDYFGIPYPDLESIVYENMIFIKPFKNKQIRNGYKCLFNPISSGPNYKKCKRCIPKKYKSLSDIYSPIYEPEEFKNFYIIKRTKNTITHPAKIEEKFIIDLLIKYTCESDIILDPFGGSGSTALSAYSTDRRFISSEISTSLYLKQKELFNNIKYTSIHLVLE